jgi:hypothetical protein
MHRTIAFLASLILFALFVYGLLQLYRRQNGGAYPWQSGPSDPPVTRGGTSGPTQPPK